MLEFVVLSLPISREQVVSSFPFPNPTSISLPHSPRSPSFLPLALPPRGPNLSLGFVEAATVQWRQNWEIVLDAVVKENARETKHVISDPVPGIEGVVEDGEDPRLSLGLRCIGEWGREEAYCGCSQK